ncbi:MAG: hypothetical protein D4R57_00015 [Verrucomicrobiales bacterium]|nr:MAG: hypothetical protein D4R57_00015 [Verrucomicrobiales bacterium]
MTTPGSGDLENSFVSKKLPRLIGAAAILHYFLTLGHWITPGSLENISRIAGWDAQPTPARPLAWTLFAAFRFLPEAWIPLAANVFTALVATLVLVLLARCVALLRYDVLPEGDIRKTSQIGLLVTPSAWMPPVMAALVCGLQLGFWEHATSATGEMPALLLFACAVRSLLEFRITQKEPWLVRGVMAFGAGMADNWVMAGYFPVLLAALIGLKSFRAFLKPRFLLRMALCGLAGMVLCLLLPMLAKLWSSGSDEMWAGLLAHFKTQKRMLWLLKLAPFRLLALTGLIPFLILSVRWKSHTIQLADDTSQGVFMAKATGHFVHALFLVVALWFALEPGLGPRDFDSGGGLLIHRFIWALAAGYCAGYTLLFKEGKERLRPSKLAAAGIRLLLLATTALLLWKNFGSIQLTNSAATREFVKALADDLPSGNAVVLGEEVRTLLLLRGELGSRSRDREVMLVDTTQLISPRYHERMSTVFNTRWPKLAVTNTAGRITPETLVLCVAALAANEAVFYAHPSSGLFFEKFAGEPQGALHRLVLRTSDETSAAPRSRRGNEADSRFDVQHTNPPSHDGGYIVRTVSDNEHLWQTRWSSHIGKLAARIEAQRNNVERWKSSSLKWLRVADQGNATAMFLGGAYSKALNHWGVQLQHAGRGSEATEWFRRAITLNPANLAANINLEFAERRMRGDNSRLGVAWAREHFAEAFVHYENWYEVISRNGPVDEPTFLLQTGRLLLNTGNPRQAITAFERCAELSLDWPMPKLFEAQAWNVTGDFARALELTTALENNREQFRGPGLAQLLQCRVNALRGLGRTNDAWDNIEQYVARHTKHGEVISAAATLCAAGGRFERELELLMELSSRAKPDVGLLTRRGLAEFRLGRNKQAEETLTRALDLAPEDVQVRLLRAVARLGDGQAAAARADYELLLKNPGGSQPALLGLGSLAWREQDTNAAIRYYEQFMSNNAAASPQTSVVSERLKQMRDEQ